MKQACSACPDGNEWTANGPTGRACQTCGGKAYVGEDEPVNAEGPEGTTGCACVHSDPGMCAALRYGERESISESCECLCHIWDDEE